jgi:membrane protein
LFASTAWKIATAGFTWYVTSGFGRYQLVYGSLGAVVALLFLIYLISMITLFGAHLSAAINGWLDKKINASTAQSLERNVTNGHIEPN